MIKSQHRKDKILEQAAILFKNAVLYKAQVAKYSEIGSMFQVNSE